MVDLKSGKKRMQLEDELKNEIISGKLKPGDRLPTYEELGNKFEASRATFHHVLNHLKRDLYTVSVERSGTFVAGRIPCRTRIGLVFRIDENENAFWSKIAQAAEIYNRTHSDYEFIPFRSQVMQVSLKAEYQELQDQLSRKMLATLFFPYAPRSKNLLAILNSFPEVPLILFESLQVNQNNLMVRLSPEHSTRLAMQYFKEQGVERVAPTSGGISPQLGYFQKEVDAAGLKTRKEWLIPVSREYDSAVENFTRLLLSLPPEQRPQGLYVTDDNHLNQVQRAIIESGIRVPQDLKLVCHTNFPDTTEPVLPVQRVGYDVNAIVQAIISLTDLHYSGSSERQVVVPAEFESDVTARSSAPFHNLKIAVNH